jgi:hypothetical protein
MSTLHPRTFIGQATLEAWLDSGRAELADGRLRLLARGAVYRLEPAARLVAVVAEGPAAGAVGRVLSDARVQALGGEALGRTVLVADTAFETEPGWIGALEAEEGP